MMKDGDATVATLETIRAKGVRTSMDDFGTGYSSLSYMRRLPFDKIKIDKTFIAELGVRDDTTAIVRAAVALAQALGMQTVAEGIETEEQLARARVEGITEAQGYLTGRPMPARQALALLGVEPVEEDDAPKAESRARAADAEIGGCARARQRHRLQASRRGEPACPRVSRRGSGRPAGRKARVASGRPRQPTEAPIIPPSAS